MEFWEKYDIKDEYINDTLTITTKAFILTFDIKNTDDTAWEYYYNNGFDYVFSARTN